jgi:hypothetical protein
MTMDIVDRLRKFDERNDGVPVVEEAADEIEGLRLELQQVRSDHSMSLARIRSSVTSAIEQAIDEVDRCDGGT